MTAPATYTVTLTRDELFELQLGVEARHNLLRDRIRVMTETAPAVFGGEQQQRDAVDSVRDHDRNAQRAHAKLVGARVNSPGLSAMLTEGQGR